jgi:hypothetical protein
MLKSLLPNRNLNRTIKALSTGLIVAALGLELGTLIAYCIGIELFTGLAVICWVGRIALVIHVMEGAIAAVNATLRQRSALRYGIYTFFVGTVGLLELRQIPQTLGEQPWQS